MPPKEAKSICKSKRGFTLIEILIVMGLVGFIAALAIPRLESTNSKLRREVRNITVLMKRVHHLARLKRQTYRLVFEFPENGQHQYWVETSTKKVYYEPSVEADEDLTEEEYAAQEKAKGFALDQSLTKKAINLSHGIFIESIEFTTEAEPTTSGSAYIHFLPEGFAEESAIMFTDGKDLHWTVILNPLTGQGEIINGAASLKDRHK